MLSASQIILVFCLVLFKFYFKRLHECIAQSILLKKKNKTKQNNDTPTFRVHSIQYFICCAVFNVALKIYSSLFQASMNEITLTG